MTRLTLFLAAAFTLAAQAPVPAPPTIPLWQGAAPGALGTADADIPQLLIFAPTKQITTATGIIGCPGG